MFVNRLSKSLKYLLMQKRAFCGDLFAKIISEYKQLNKLINESKNTNISLYKQYNKYIAVTL